MGILAQVVGVAFIFAQMTPRDNRLGPFGRSPKTLSFGGEMLSVLPIDKA
jgi:hypothetical protein